MNTEASRNAVAPRRPPHPIPTEERIEAFSREMVLHQNRAKAYREMFPEAHSYSNSAVSRHANTWARLPEVVERMKEMRGELQQRTLTTMEEVDSMYKQIFFDAMETGKLGPAVQATNGLSKLHGFDAPERHEVDIGPRALAQRAVEQMGPDDVNQVIGLVKEGGVDLVEAVRRVQTVKQIN